MMKELIMNWLKRWAAPYSPINPVEISEKDSEMQKLSHSLDDMCIDTLIDLQINEQDEMHQTYMKFISIYLSRHKSENIVDRVFKQLSNCGPSRIIEMIGYFRLPALYNRLVDKIDYSCLDESSKFSLISTLLLLKNKSCLQYIQLAMIHEKNSEILADMGVLRASALNWE